MENPVFGDVEARRHEHEAPQSSALLRFGIAVLRAIKRAGDERQLAEAICEAAIDAAGARYAWVAYRGAPSEPAVRPVAAAGIEDGYLCALQSRGRAAGWRDEPAVRALSSGRPALELNIDLPAVNGWRAEARARGWASAAALPLRKDDFLGTLALYWREAPALNRGDLDLLATIARDIADAIVAKRETHARRESERQLLRMQAHLAAAEQLAHVGTFEFDTPDTPAFWTDETFRITGRDPSLGAMTAEEFVAHHVHPDDRERMHDELRGLLSRGGVSDTEYRILRTDGEVRWVRTRTRALLSEAGEVVGVIGTLLDITERKQTEMAIREREEMMRYIVKHDPNALAVLDRDMRYIAVSDRFLHDYGVRREDVLGRGHYEIFPEIDERWRAIHRRVLAGAVERNDDDSFVRSDGSITYNRWECRPWYQADGTIGGMIMYTEVTTERKKMELALHDAARRKDEFLAMLGHELRNPLAPIRNAGFVLKQCGSADPRAARAIAVIERQVAHLSRIVDDLLNVTRISRGKITLQLEHVDLAALVRTAAEDSRAEAEHRGIRLEMEVPEEPRWVMGDPARLIQVVTNLLGNAIKFTDAGGRIDVRLAADGAMAVLTVADTGIGMKPETLGRIFEPFMQAERDAPRSRGGLGLGLALVKGLVALHGGTVAAESPGTGLGTTLTVRLPMGEAPAASPDTCDELLAMTEREICVLVITATPESAAALQARLESFGAHVELASDGMSGVLRARELKPALILCDLSLPGEFDGFHVARALRADAAMRGTMLVAMGDAGDPVDRRRAEDAGFDRQLRMPANPGDLERLLREVGSEPPRTHGPH